MTTEIILCCTRVKDKQAKIVFKLSQEAHLMSPEVIKHFSCRTQLSMQIKHFMNIKNGRKQRSFLAEIFQASYLFCSLMLKCLQLLAF